MAENVPQEKILVRIGDRVITTDDFKRRAEYTVRPPYCNGDNYIHRKIVLNSLIAEKLFALETQNDNELLNNAQFHDYLQGRQEQSMRQWLFYKDFYDRVELEPADIQEMVKISGRQYSIDYVSIKDNAIAQKVRSYLENDVSFDDLFASIEQIPRRKVTWESQENSQIHNALYSGLLEKGKVVGPLKIEENDHIVMRIAGYSDVLDLTDFDVQNRIRDIKERMKMDRAIDEYSRFVQRLMKGKRIDFNPETFTKLVTIIAPLYQTQSDQQENAFKQQVWDDKVEGDRMITVADDIDEIDDEPLLKIGNEVWTVARFINELNIHPLVFRKKQMKKSEFSEQFKYAIADMIRDKHIADAARKKGYEKSVAVVMNVNMWKDYLLGLYNRNQILSEKNKLDTFQDDYLTIIEQDLDPYVRRLRQKYADRIQINTDLFEQIQLSRIDMLAVQSSVPFPIMVPNFPLMTMHNKLDYGRKMQSEGTVTNEQDLSE
ncbi:hypothetical protein JW992_09245 [candidate division KSB1 bacterium]|nr:hypothetical protein [candidate division KSB1 bacterium]